MQWNFEFAPKVYVRHDYVIGEQWLYMEFLHLLIPQEWAEKREKENMKYSVVHDSEEFHDVDHSSTDYLLGKSI